LSFTPLAFSHDLALYIHFPWCVRKCPYCDFNSHQRPHVFPEEEYLQALIQNLATHDRLLKTRTITSLFLGGGTPSLFQGATIHRLLKHIHAHYRVAPHAEITLEANPGTAERDRFLAFREAGVTRLSLGAQSFSSQALHTLGRIHNEDDVHHAIAYATQAQFPDINIDLMYGLPHQTLEESLYDLRLATASPCTHLSWYQLTLEPNTAFYRTPPQLPTEDTLWDMYREGLSYLQKNGWEHYEISSHHRKRACQHNMMYWKYGDYLGIGAGAHSKITLQQEHGDYLITRFHMRTHPSQYLAMPTARCQEQAVSIPDRCFEFALNAFRLHQPIPWSLFEATTLVSRAIFLSYAHEAHQQGWLTWDDTALSVTSSGRLYYNDLVASIMTLS
jgi:putative oxygen-independent coproporphyrinogen III oxidase